MPTYEYQCDKCKKTFEAYQSMKDPALSICLKDLCQQKSWGKGKVKRLLGTGAGLIFKGSGFYVTDYRSEGYKASEKKESGDREPKPDTQKSEGKAESAPKPGGSGGSGAESAGKPEAGARSESAGKSKPPGAAESAGKPRKPSKS